MGSFFQRLFGSRSKNKAEETGGAPGKNETPSPPAAGLPTQPLSQIEAGDVSSSSAPVEPAQLMSGCAQSTGLQRSHNEDALFNMSTTFTNNGASLTFGLYIVADGMGGHRHGEIASGLAVRTVAGHVIRTLTPALFDLHPGPPEESLQEILREGIHMAYQVITKEAPGGGTTLTAALIVGDQITIAHLGDSRAYGLSKTGRLETLTRDHSLVKRLVELGQITPEEAAVHPQRNVLYRALGQGEPAEADISMYSVHSFQYLLLCSDGLWGVIPEQTLAELVREATSLDIACQKMMDAANAAGGPDNITAVLIRMPE